MRKKNIQFKRQGSTVFLQNFFENETELNTHLDVGIAPNLIIRLSTVFDSTMDLWNRFCELWTGFCSPAFLSVESGGEVVEIVHEISFSNIQYNRKFGLRKIPS